jgi:hypothetical protein
MTPEQTTKFCKDFLREVVDLINLTHPDFTCASKWDWSTRRTTCWGGPKGISMAMSKFYLPMTSEKNPMKFYEYKSFCKDSVIGDFWTEDFILAYKAIICHEVAHALMSHLKVRRKIGNRIKGAGHGPAWKEAYADLRKVFVNPYIKRSLTGDDASKQKEREDEEKDCYLTKCDKYGLELGWFGNKFITYNGREYRIFGLNTRARKYPVLGKEISTGKRYKFEVSVVKDGIKRAQEIAT